MALRSHHLLGLALLASLALNLLLGLGLISGRLLEARAQAVDESNGFIVATEQTSDQSPVCFVFDTRKPHLLVYRADAAGLLQLTSSRNIECDLLLPDNHMPRGQIRSKMRTQPPVSEVCKAVRTGADDKDKKEDAEEEEKKEEDQKKDGEPKKKDR